MATRHFTEEEMEALRTCPYVLDVNPHFVYFATEFKELFWTALQKGEQPHDIVTSFGVDPDILGKARLSGLTSTIKRDGNAGEGFKNVSSYRLDAKRNINPVVKIKYLEQELAYKNQEIEFLKKIALLGKEGSGQ
jgi:hypothetical protein